MVNIMTADSMIIAMIIVSIIYLLYAFWRLNASESIRVELIYLHEGLMERTDITESHKQLLTSLLDVVFSWKFVAKITWTMMIVPTKTLQTNFDDSKENFLSDDRVRYFCIQHLRAALAVNPMWAIIFKIVILLKILVLKIRIITSRYNSEIINSSKLDVETKYLDIFGNFYRN